MFLDSLMIRPQAAPLGYEDGSAYLDVGLYGAGAAGVGWKYGWNNMVRKDVPSFAV